MLALTGSILAFPACGEERDGNNVFSAGESIGATDSAGDGGDGDGDGDGGPKLDTQVGGSGDGADGAGAGCEKADFLFIIDNSGSMTEEQQQLVNSFPGFISTIQSELNAQDYHIMVVDTDESPGFGSSLTCTNGVCTCSPEPQCCFGMCTNGAFGMPPPPTCAGQPCSNFVLPTGCPVTLGAGKAEDRLFADCGFASGKRYITSAEADVAGAFECAALVGAGGDGNERPMEAMVRATGPLNQAGQCNEGFLRDDAILVVTFITDEAETGSMGDPNTWKQALVTAKHGDEAAVVVLGVIGDGTCQNAQDAPLLRQFAESFTQGQWGDICAPDYSPFFQDAISVIDLACDNFTPPG